MRVTAHARTADASEFLGSTTGVGGAGHMHVYVYVYVYVHVYVYVYMCDVTCLVRVLCVFLHHNHDLFDVKPKSTPIIRAQGGRGPMTHD